MKVLVFSDIFGHTSSVNELVGNYKNMGVSAELITPYNTDNQPFISQYIEDKVLFEAQTYQHFIAQCGHDKYLNIIEQKLDELNDLTTPIVIIGFSAGASACWRALSVIPPSQTSHFIGFYPSQVRHYLTQPPHCQTSIVFPKSEPSFDVSKAICQIESNANVQCIHENAQHGFYNSLSPNYNEDIALYYQRVLLTLDTLTSLNSISAKPIN